MTEHLSDLPPNPNDPPKASTKAVSHKSYQTAYMLWLFFGWIGAHRFYTGKYFTGLLYAASFGFFFMGWALDFILTYFMVGEANRKADRRAAKLAEQPSVPAALAMPAKESLMGKKAPWAENTGALFSISLSLRFLFFIFAPAIFVFIALFLNQMALAILFAAMLIIIGFVGNTEKLLPFMVVLERIPGVCDAISLVEELNDYYYHNKPRLAIFYILYPILWPVYWASLAKARIEFKIYFKIVRAFALFLLLDLIYSYSYIYPPHLGLQDAFLIICLQLFFVFFMIPSFMVPMTATSFTLSLSGRKKSIMFLTMLSLLIALPAGYWVYQKNQTQISQSSFTILEWRLEKPNFQKEFAEATEMFLTYHYPKLVAPTTSNVLQVDDNLTTKYRTHLSSLIPNDEPRGFHLATFAQEVDGQNRIWCVIFYEYTKHKIVSVLDYERNFVGVNGPVPEFLQQALNQHIESKKVNLKK